MDFHFLFKSNNIIFTFFLTFALLNMIGKVCLQIFKILRDADYLKVTKKIDEKPSLTKSYIKNFSDTSKISATFDKLSEKSLLKYFFHLDKISGFTVLNIVLFIFGISGIYLSSLLFKFFETSHLSNFLLSFTSAIIVTLVTAKIILFVISKIVPRFNTDAYPKIELLNLPAWVLRKKGNVYLCQVFEPCGQSFKVDVALPVAEKQIKYRTPIMLQNYNSKTDCFEGDYITVEQALKIFENRENTVFVEVKTKSIYKNNLN